MIVPNQRVKVKWNTKNKEILASNGYKFTKMGDELEIDLKFLPKGSSVLVKVKCDRCGKERLEKYKIAIKRKNHFCDAQCMGLFNRGENNSRYSRKEVNCSYCGQKFVVKNYRYEKLLNGEQNGIFCSIECLNKNNGQNLKGESNPHYKNRITKICKYCKKEYTIPPNRKDRNKYCSKQCMMNYLNKNKPITKRRLANCDNCGKKFERWEYEINKYKYHFCSKECKNEQSGLFLSHQTRETEIQNIINNLLNDLEIDYINEYPIKYYAVDNYLTDYDLIIEVMGDYWHTNPNVYKDKKELNQMQLRRIKTDKSKKSYIKKV